MPTFAPQEVYLIEQDGQTVIELSHPYVIDASEINVYLNGMLSVINEDYTEIDNLHVEFKYQLSMSDVVIIEHKVYFDDKLVTVIGRKGKALYQQYGTTETLLKNQTYTLIFQHGVQSFTSKFNTMIDSLYAGIETIRNDLGNVLDGLADESRILFLIFENSILSKNIASADNLTLLEQSVTDNTPVPYVFKQYVRYRTELDIVMAMYLYASGRQGSESKALGQLKLNKQLLLGMTPLEPIMSDLKQKLKTWEKKLTGGAVSSPVATAVRGGTSNPYPLTSPRNTFASGDGTAGA
jgi:hypothetical protein